MLTPEQADQLRTMESMEGWQTVLKAWMLQEGNQLIRYLLDPSIARPEPYDKLPDDYIRGEIKRIQRTIDWVANQLQAAAHNRRLDEEARQRTDGSVSVP